jgi:hypothetical protein
MPSLDFQDQVINAVIADLARTGKAKPGTPVVVVQGENPVAGATNIMRIQYC